MTINRFIEGAEPDSKGRDIETVLSFCDSDIENIHDFIQWIFPLREASRAVFNAPVLSDEDVSEISKSETSKSNIIRASKWYLGFLGRNKHWVTKYDHNHLRITRVIKSIRLLVGNQEAENFRESVFEMLGEEKSKIDPKAVTFWLDA